MAEFIISSYFEDNTGPITGLSPTVRVWEVSSAGSSLIIGSPCGTGLSTDGAMSEVENCGSPATTQDGFYQFVFNTGLGYDPSKEYLVRVDGGPALATRIRYQTGEITSLNVENISDGVWDEPRADHLDVGSTGEVVSLIKADTADIIDKLYLDADSVLDVVQLLLKMEAGRTRIDPTAKTLTVFDEDCTTPLRVFELLDSGGNPSITEVCERVPTTKGAGDGTSITDVCP